MSELKTYNADSVSISIGGNTIVGPFAEDAVNIDPSGDDWNFLVGFKGGMTRGKQQEGRHYDVTISLQASSPSNKTLEALRILDRDDDGPGAPFVLDIRDASLGETFSSRQAFIMTAPPRGKTRAVPVYEWTFKAPFGRFDYD